MITKRIALTCLAASLAATPATQVTASDALVGGIVGGIIGGAIVREGQRPRTTTTRTVQPRATVNTSQRQANRDVQASLNYFGFPAGTVDGIIGRNTRNAITQYQVFMGYAGTGQLSEFERSFLVNAYHRAMAGGQVTAQMVASNPQGTRGLLLQYRDEMTGTAGGTMAAAPPVPAAQPPVAAAIPALPNFMGDAVTQASVASHCNRVNLITGSNGGFVTAANMRDPALALDEQFCLARTYAIGSAEDLAARVPGSTPQQLVSQCAAFGPAMRAQITALSVRPAPEVLSEVAGFVVGMGMAPAQLAGSARICLGTGYRVDDTDVALASALILVGLGEQGYAELLGHHLIGGFGVTARKDLAMGWYDIAVASASAGSRSPFAPGQPERVEVIRVAVDLVGGRAQKAPTLTLPTALPSFNLTPAD